MCPIRDKFWLLAEGSIKMSVGKRTETCHVPSLFVRGHGIGYLLSLCLPYAR